jgi:hypothetical protein
MVSQFKKEKDWHSGAGSLQQTSEVLKTGMWVTLTNYLFEENKYYLLNKMFFNLSKCIH